MAARPCRAAQPAVAADRFARKIEGFLAGCVMRLRQLNANPLGRTFKACARTEAASLIFRCLPISLLAIYLPPIDLITI
jgi:hypothetical protein